MNLANYINDLLYRYDCVIIPNFGGFVTNKISAKVHAKNQTMQPPKKQVTFNAYLKHNDGLLANYIATTEAITYKEALHKIATEVALWKTTLKEETVVLKNIGNLALSKEKTLVFTPNTTSNFLTESFGLATVNSKEQKRETPKKEERKTAVIPLYAKRAAAAVVLLGLGYTGWNAMEQTVTDVKPEIAATKKIQAATFAIENPLPKITPVVKKEIKRFHIVGGAFSLEENAKKKVLELQNLGYEAHIIGKNKWNLHQVALQSYSTKEEARVNLLTIQKEVNKQAWLLEK